MIDAESMRLIRVEIAKQLNVILSGVSGTNTDQTEDISQLFPGGSSIGQRPVMQPFGLSSRAPNGTLQVTGRMGDYIGNRMVLGHRDKNKPPVADQGGTTLYDAFGHKLTFASNGLEITNGEIQLLDQIIALIQTIIDARTNTIFGPEPLIPDPTKDEKFRFIAIRDKLIQLKGGQ